MKQSVHFSGEHLRLYRLHRIMHTKCIFSGTFGIFCTFCTLLELRAGNSNIVWLLMCWDNYSRIKNIKPHRYTAVHLYQACRMYQQGYIYQQGWWIYHSGQWMYQCEYINLDAGNIKRATHKRFLRDCPLVGALGNAMTNRAAATGANIQCILYIYIVVSHMMYIYNR